VKDADLTASQASLPQESLADEKEEESGYTVCCEVVCDDLDVKRETRYEPRRLHRRVKSRMDHEMMKCERRICRLFTSFDYSPLACFRRRWDREKDQR
jgi:hypothetical protein